KRWDVFLPLAQRRELNFHHVQAEEKIAPERALFHLPGEIAIGGGDDAEIGAPYCKRSKRPEFFLLEHPQQFRLQIEWQLADFVEKRRAAVGGFDQPGLAVRGAGESPLTWPKSSLSISGPTSAEQSMVMKGPWGFVRVNLSPHDFFACPRF